ncbi:hypothetical protein ACIBCL_00395 [Micromonospora zamorensis]|uniref:hypothetical protein n=1 Tax=Micromonospora zamorensis TaxID=709883 RepID=UPI00379555B3
MADLDRLGKLIEELHSARLIELGSDSPQQVALVKVAEEINVRGTLNFTIGSDDGEVYPFVGLIAEDEDEVAGPIPEVLSEVDRRSVKRLKFVAALGPSERLRVTLTREAEEAVVIDVVSQRTGWAKQAYARLADEIEKGVPRWATLRSGGPKFGLSILPPLALALFVALVLPKSLDDDRDFVGIMTFLVAWPFFWMDRLYKWLFPGFELVGEGGQSSGTRRIATLSLLAASIPIGVLVNAIS